MMATPVVVIVGRPNVGKSTLFNQLTKSRSALVADMPGVTRDRQYGSGALGERPFVVIDTGGLGAEDHAIDTLMAQQSWQAVEEADVILLMADGRSGLTGSDVEIANALRSCQKPVLVVVNKTDGLNPEVATADFYALGFGAPIPIAASHGRGVMLLIEAALKPFPLPVEDLGDIPNDSKNSEIKLAIVGRPNVGKSTLVNRIVGFSRVVVFDAPGTTRDSIYIPLERLGQKYVLIDTAGLRRRSRVSEALEKFSVVKTLKAIEDCHVAILVLDAAAGLTDQDLGLLGFILEAGRSLVIAVNKWDDVDLEQKTQFKKSLEYRLEFASFAKVHFISALHGRGINSLLDSVRKTYQSAIRQFSASQLTRALEQAVAQHPPPMVHRRRIKLRYAHTGGHCPPLIVIHGNQTEQVPETYKRYLMNTFRKHLKLIGTPIRLEFKTSENPFSSKRNTLTPRQEYKRKRLMKFVKKKR